MTCPNCKQPMKKRKVDETILDHCPFCGGTYFDINEINRIPLAEAEKLAKDAKSESISGGQKYCPRDDTPLKPTSRESVPQFVTLLECSKCHGVFAFPKDLVDFKQAQEAKVAYLRAWKIPVPALRTVLVFGILMAVALSAAYTLQQPQQVSIKAVQDICTVQITHAEESSIVYCKTQFEFTSEAVFVNAQTGEQIIRVVNTEPEKVHALTVNHANVAPSPNVCVRLVLHVGEQTLETECTAFENN